MTKPRKAALLIIYCTIAAPVAAQQPDPGPVRGGPKPLLMLRHKSVQEELKLEADQLSKVKELMMKMRDKMIALVENGERDKVGPIIKDHEKELSKILTPAQAKRLQEVTLQVHGLWAMTEPETAAQLKITDEQKAKLRNLQSDTAKQMNKLFTGGEATTRTEAQKKMAMLHEAATQKGLEILEKEQRQTWSAMLGKPFTGEIQRVAPMGLGKQKQ